MSSSFEYSEIFPLAVGISVTGLGLGFKSHVFLTMLSELGYGLHSPRIHRCLFGYVVFDCLAGFPPPKTWKTVLGRVGDSFRGYSATGMMVDGSCVRDKADCHYP